MLFQLTLYKYVICLIIILLIIRENRLKSKIQIPANIKFFYLLVFFYFFLSLPDFIEYGWGGFLLWKQFMWLPIFVIIFTRTHYLTSFSQHQVVLLFVRVMFLYCFLNCLFYFIELPIWKNYHVYMGRITVGYPTVDVVITIFALLVVLFHPHLQFKYLEKTVYIVTFVLSILSQASGTGIFLLVFCFVTVGIYLLRTRKIKTTSLILAIAIISFSAANILSYMRNNNSALYDNIMLQIENRVYVMIGKGHQAEMNVNTLDIRQEEYIKAEKKHSGEIGVVFGHGFGKVTGNIKEITSNIFLIEDQYHIIKFAMGWLGVLLFYSILVTLFFRIFFSRIELSYKYLYCSVIVCLVSSTFTAFSMGTIGICGSLAIIISDSPGIFKKSHIVFGKLQKCSEASEKMEFFMRC